MRPRDMPSTWVKVLPWYYTKKEGRPGRGEARREAIEDDLAASKDTSEPANQ